MALLNTVDLNFREVLDEVSRVGACQLKGFLTEEARTSLLNEVQKAPLQPAEELVGEVSQDFSFLNIDLNTGGADFPQVQQLFLEYTRFLQLQAETHSLEWLRDFAPTEVSIQKYGPCSTGISPHKDGLRFKKLVSIFSLMAPAQLTLCRDREGTPIKSFALHSGDLLLIRGPGFGGDKAQRPIHRVDGPEEGVRYSVTFRREEARA